MTPIHEQSARYWASRSPIAAISINNRIEQDHRGIKQRYYPMRGFGTSASAARFCRAFDEQRHYFRMRTSMRQPLPPLAEQRREYCARTKALMSELMVA